MDAFLDEQRSVGRIESQGEFTVDLVSLRRKLGAFQFVQGEEYILKIIQAGVGARADRIDVRLLGFDAEVTYHAPGEALLDLESLRIALENPQALSDGPLRDLAVGIFGAVAERADEVLCSNQTHCLRIWEDGSEIKPRDSAGKSPEFTFHMIRRLDGNFVQRLGSRVRETLAEKTLVATRCVYSPVPIWLDGLEITGHTPATRADRLAERHLPTRGLGLIAKQPQAAYVTVGSRTTDNKKLLVGKSFDLLLFEHGAPESPVSDAVLTLVKDALEPASLVFVQRGVTLNRMTLPDGILGSLILADGEGLTTDLSGFKIVENDASRHRIQTLNREIRQFGKGLMHLWDYLDSAIESRSPIPKGFAKLVWGGIGLGVGMGLGSMVGVSLILAPVLTYCGVRLAEHPGFIKGSPSSEKTDRDRLRKVLLEQMSSSK